MTKWQREIVRFAKYSMQISKKKYSFRQHRNYTRFWAKFYKEFEQFKQSNNELLEDHINS